MKCASYIQRQSLIYLITTKKIMVDTVLHITLICSILVDRPKNIHLLDSFLNRKKCNKMTFNTCTCHVAALLIYRNRAAATGHASSNHVLSFQTEAKQMCSLVRQWRHFFWGWNTTIYQPKKNAKLHQKFSVLFSVDTPYQPKKY